MKTLSITSHLFKTLCLFALVSFSSFTNSYAGKSNEGSLEIYVNEARDAVASAHSDDWYTLAKSAKVCLDMNVNVEEANKWLDRSLTIKETSYNLEVKADYFKNLNEDEKAIEYYLKSMSKIYLEN